MTEKALTATKKGEHLVKALKVPGKIVRNGIVAPINISLYIVTKSLNTLRKTPKVVNKSIVTKRLNNARNLVKGTKIANDVDNVLTGGEITKGLAYKVAENSAGVANILTPLFGVVNLAIHGDKYNGVSKANDSLLVAIGNQSPVRLVIYGDGNFKKYNKPLYLNGVLLNNTYYGKLYPANSIEANKNLKGTMLSANSENMYGTDNNTPIIDSHRFRMKFTNNIVRSSDTWDWNPYTLSGKIMNAITKPTWKYPNSGIVTFIDETPVKYTNNSDSTLTKILYK